MQAREVARSLRGMPAFGERKVERSRGFAHLKRILKMGRLSLRGP